MIDLPKFEMEVFVENMIQSLCQPQNTFHPKSLTRLSVTVTPALIGPPVEAEVLTVAAKSLVEALDIKSKHRLFL